MDGTLLLIGMVALYFMPTITAAARKHHNAGAIFMLNLFTGWLVIGWIGALVWACTAVRAPSSPASDAAAQPPAVSANPRPAEANSNDRSEPAFDGIQIGGLHITSGQLSVLVPSGIIGLLLLVVVLNPGGGEPPAAGEMTEAQRDRVRGYQERVAANTACSEALVEVLASYPLATEQNWSFAPGNSETLDEGLVRCQPYSQVGRSSGLADQRYVVRVEALEDSAPLRRAVRIESSAGETVADEDQLRSDFDPDRASSSEGPSTRTAATTPDARPLPVTPRGLQWHYSTSRSEMTDFTNHYLSVSAEGHAIDRYGRRIDIRLYVRCQENTTALIVATEEYLGLDSTRVEWRIGNRPMFTRSVGISTNNESFGFWRGGQSIPVIRQILADEARRLTVRYTPYGENPRTVRFDIAGLNDRIQPLREACSW